MEKNNSVFSKASNGLQIFGRSMLLAISAMPAAAILNRLASDDLFNIPFLKEAAWTIFAILPLIFAVSVAGGITRDKHIAAGVASVIAYNILIHTLREIDKTGLNSFGRVAVSNVESNILIGIIAGLVAGISYNKFKDKALPSALAFFGGRRLVIIMSSFFAIIVSWILSYIFPTLDEGILSLGKNIGTMSMGPFIFGFLNRLLIPTGLHHILATYIQMQLPSTLKEFANVTGEIPRFFAGDPTAGSFVSGMFPMMMFGLPGAAFAMYSTAYEKNKKRVKGLLLGAAFTAFLTGITEPVEFSFMFVSPILFLVHASLTGFSNVICKIFGAKIIGVGGSGIIDYFLQFNKATKPLLIIPIGIVLFLLYYFIFRFLIIKLDIKTPGREDETITSVNKDISLSDKASSILKYVGGRENIVEFENCITRLRIKLKDMSKLDAKKLKEIGVIEVMKMSNNNVHLVIGLEVEQLANEIQPLLSEEKVVEKGTTDLNDIK